MTVDTVVSCRVEMVDCLRSFLLALLSALFNRFSSPDSRCWARVLLHLSCKTLAVLSVMMKCLYTHLTEVFIPQFRATSGPRSRCHVFWEKRGHRPLPGLVVAVVVCIV